jgi:hypothetical protein
MSNFDEKLIQRLTKLEREVGRLKVKESHKAGMYTKDTYFDDLQYQMVGQKLTSPSARISYGTNGDYIVFAKSCDYSDDWLTMVIQMSHRWKLGTAIYPHLHWVQTAAGMPNWLIGYRWNVNGAATNAAAWSLIPHSANAYTYSAGSLNQITKFDKISPPVGAGLSDLVHIKIFRDVSNESTAFTGGAENDAATQDNAAASSFDVHFEIDQAGSDEEYTK